MRQPNQRPTGTRIAAGVLALGLIAAACGSSDDDAGADQSDEAIEAPDTTAAPDEVAEEGVVEEGAVEEPVEDAADDTQSAVTGLPPIDADCADLPDTDDATRSFDAAPPMCLEEGALYTATVNTSAGTITIDLDQTLAPTTVNSFVFLARNNYFDDTVCHRIIQEFVVQCGDPTATGTGGPGYTIPDEFPAAGQYEVGSIAMAKTQEPNSGGSQFFIITGAQGMALPPEYSLFGQVEAPDLGVVETMNAQGSLDTSGVPGTELRIESVEITQS